MILRTNLETIVRLIFKKENVLIYCICFDFLLKEKENPVTFFVLKQSCVQIVQTTTHANLFIVNYSKKTLCGIYFY